MKIYQSIGNKKKVKDMICISEKNFQDSPGPRVKNPPTSAGYMASIPGPGRPHKLGGGAGELSPYTSTTEPEAPELVFGNKRSRSSEKPIHCS